MTERKKASGTEFLYDPNEEKSKKIAKFVGNFNLFLDEEVSRLKLLELPFVGDIQKLIVANFKENEAAPFEYGHMEQDLLAVIARYRMSYTEPVISDDSFILDDHGDIPDRLKSFVGTTVVTKTENYALVSLPGEKATVSRIRFFAFGANDKPLYEYWLAERTSEEEPLPDDGSRKGSALKIPTPEYSLTR